MQKISRWMLRLLLVGAGLIVVLIAGIMIYQPFSDGPNGPLAGGEFRTGEPTQIHDWSDLDGDFEFELVGQGTSRTAGGITLDGQLYISCDLGFVWSRLPSGVARHMLHVIWIFKDWHHDALQDGRIRIRKNGRIYDAHIELEQNPEVIEGLKVRIETLAADFFAPNEIGPRPTQEPNDIWFFKVTQR